MVSENVIMENDISLSIATLADLCPMPWRRCALAISKANRYEATAVIIKTCTLAIGLKGAQHVIRTARVLLHSISLIDYVL